MDFSLTKVIQVLSFIIFFNSAVRAQEVTAPPEQQAPVEATPTEELTLENELNQAQGQPESTSIPVSTEPVSTEFPPAQNNPENSSVPADAVSEMNLDIEGQEVETLEQEYAMDGYSIGATYFNHNYNIYADLLINDATVVDLSERSSDFQSAGVMARYAVLPYNKIGTDINISLATTLNHSSVNYSSITTLRGELNLGYAFQMGSSTSLYFLAGLGYEVTKGKDIEEILTPGAGTFQVGGGLGLGKKFDVEVFYSYVSHAINDGFLEKAAAEATTNGATSVSYDTSESSVTSNIIMGRLTYNY